MRDDFFAWKQRGDVLLVRDSAEEGWLMGEMDGRVGLIPAPYVQFMQSNAHNPEPQGSKLEEGHAHSIQRAEHGHDRGTHECDSSAQSSGLWNHPSVSTPKDGWKSSAGHDLSQQSEDKSVNVKAMKELAERQHTLLSDRSRKLATNRKPDKKGNYGEFLYLEGTVHVVIMHRSRHTWPCTLDQHVYRTFSCHICLGTCSFKKHMYPYSHFLMLCTV